MKKLLVASLILLTGCGAVESTSVENKTEVVTEIFTTEQISTEVNTAEKLTEEVKIAVTTPPKEVLNAKRVISEAKTEEKTEDKMGDIDVNGYGWIKLQYSEPYKIMEGHLTRSNGSIHVFGHRETWYSTNEPCGKATAKDIPGKHVAKDGTIRDADGYICVASSDHRFYSIVMTSVGPGKVYDCGCSHGTVDVYTNW